MKNGFKWFLEMWHYTMWFYFDDHRKVYDPKRIEYAKKGYRIP